MRPSWHWPGLFATIAGAVAVSGLDTLGAEAFTSHRGVALDTFVASP
jgi:UTP:GlnB (protein PII) uridylyltransferase